MSAYAKDAGAATGQPEPSAAPDNPAGHDSPTQPEQTGAALENRLRQTAADLDNLRKRFAREVARARESERGRVAGAFLPVLDNLDRALAHADAGPSSFAEGIAATRQQAVTILSQLGYPRHDDADTMGVMFDPSRHEVVSVIDAPDAEPGTVVGVLGAGYGDGEDQLRPVTVVVARSSGDQD